MPIFAKIAHNFDPLRLSLGEFTGILAHKRVRSEYILVNQLLTRFFYDSIFCLLSIMPSGRKVHILYIMYMGEGQTAGELPMLKIPSA
jgi:hypothetical protein